MWNDLPGFKPLSKLELFFIVVIGMLGVATASTLLAEAMMWIYTHTYISWR